MKVVTLCGSLKYRKEMMEVAEKMALDGYCVLTPIYSILKDGKTDEQLEILREEHFRRIDLSDAICVINKEKYIGKSTNLEIEYAQKKGKEICYWE